MLSFPLTDNLVLNDYYHAPYARGMVRDDDAILEYADRLIAEYDVRTPSAHVTAGTLSGGNQQKVVVAREFDGDLQLLVLDQPTRGLDVGSIEFIHRQAIAQRDAGVAVLLVSAELDEVLELSDRIGVMFRGRIVAVLDARTTNREEVGLLMATGGASRPRPRRAAMTDGRVTSQALRDANPPQAAVPDEPRRRRRPSGDCSASCSCRPSPSCWR